MNTDAVYLAHILECIRRIEANTAAGRDTFLASHTLQDAVLRNLQTMTEATQRLSGDLKTQHPHIPWIQIAAFRNILVHNYLGIDLNVVWTVIQRDVPPLKQTILEIQANDS
jgi:uncharacterized protein with HEPN domain